MIFRMNEFILAELTTKVIDGLELNNETRPLA